MKRTLNKRVISAIALIMVLIMTVAIAASCGSKKKKKGPTPSADGNINIETPDTNVPDDDSDECEHVGGEWTVEKESTCKEEGIKIKKCTVCGETVEQGTIALAKHTLGDWETEKAPTCTDRGTKFKACTVCGEKAEQGNISATGHTEGEWEIVTSVACFENGLRIKKCTVCQEQIDEEVITATGHIAGEWEVETEPTCTENGLKIAKCVSCGEKANEEIIFAPGHTPGEWVVVKEPTCTEDGLKTAECTVCGGKAAEERLLTVDHTPGEWEVERPATCTEDGLNIKKCTLCGEKQAEENVTAPGHIAGEWEIEKAPTCTEDGLRVTKCTACGEKQSEETILTDGHVKGDWITTVAPTCLEEGLKIKKCTVCEVQLEQEELSATGHTAGEWETQEASTCTKNGTQIKKCTICKEKLDEEALPLAEHTPGEWTVETEPTCMEGGVRVNTCADCGARMGEEFFFDSTKHVPGEWVTEKSPTCMEGGLSVNKCALCGESLSSKKLSVSDHTPSEWIVETPAGVGVEGLKYTECTVCYARIDEEIIPALSGEEEHECTAGEWVEVMPTSCKVAGIKIKSCTVCGEELEREEIEKLDHTPSEWIVDREPTEDENGLQHKECTVCGEIVEEEEIILPHEHLLGNWVIVKEATCVAQGEQTQSCLVCQQVVNTETLPIDADAHDLAEAVKENEVEASCTAEGSYDMVIRCKLCEDTVSEEHHTVQKKEHFEATPVRENEVDATCSNTGSYDWVVYCRDCGEELERETKALAKVAHTPGEETDEDVVEATCSAPGSYKVVIRCTVCGEKLAESPRIVNMKEHTPKSPVQENLKEATCTSKGTYDMVVYCSVCDGVVSSTSHAIDKKPHTPGEWEEIIPASCTLTGLKTKTCTVCEAQVEEEPISKLPHEESDWYIDKPAAPGEAGQMHTECIYCQIVLNTEEIPAVHVHYPGKWKVSKEATCTQKGLEIQKCITCQEKLNERETSMIAHTEGEPIIENEVNSTCTVNGTYEEIINCTKCGQQIKRTTKYKDLLPHTPGDQITDSLPTCALEGAWHKECVDCRITVDNGRIPATGDHIEKAPVEENVVDSSCTEPGSYDKVVYCSVCNTEISRTPMTIEPKGHTKTNWITDFEATCSTEGAKHKDCTVCHETVETGVIEINESAHNKGAAFKDEDSVVEATCTTEGSYDMVTECTWCGDELSRETQTVGVKDHTPGEWEETKAASCTEQGWQVKKCTMCKEEIESGPINTLPHTPEDAVVENKLDATCIATGSYDEVVYCSVCDGEISRTKKTIDIDPDAHVKGDWETVTAATCTVDGSRVRKCTLCEDIVESGVITASGHEGRTPVEENRIAPKCTVDGSYDMVTYCRICGAELARNTTPIAATGHVYGDWTVETAPTTSSAGTLTRTCAKDASHIETKAIAALSTSNGYTKVRVLDPECGSEGTDRYTITVDGTTLNFDATVEALQHTEVNGGLESAHKTCSSCGTITQDGTKHSYTRTTSIEATCTTKGTSTYTCSCGYSYTAQDIEIDADNHTGSVINGANENQHTKYSCCDKTVVPNHNYNTSVEVEATCTTKGTTAYVCSCGYSYKAQDIPKNPNNHVNTTPVNGGTKEQHTKYSCCGATASATHSMQKSTVTPATCTVGGTDTYSCACGYNYTEATNAKGHDDGAWSVTQPATCTANGTKVLKCTVCQTQLDSATISATGHTKSDWIITKVATCTESGTRVKNCTACSATGLETENIAATGHTASAEMVDPQAPDYVYTECTKCGEILSRTFKAPSTSGSTNVPENNYTNVSKPTLNDYKNGVTFNWNTDGNTANGWNIDMSGQEGTANVIQRDYINQTHLAKINNIPELADVDRFLVVNGSVKFDIFNSTTFVSGYTYYITFNYFATDLNGANAIFLEASGDASCWTGAEISKSLFRDHAPDSYNTVTIPYTVTGGLNGFGLTMDRVAAFFESGSGTFYISSIHIEYSADVCTEVKHSNGHRHHLTAATVPDMIRPGGYNWSVEELRIGETSSTIDVSSISDATAKNALAAAGYSRVLHVPDGGGNLMNFSRKSLFVPGYQYKITITYYSMYSDGGAGHLIGDLDNTYTHENHTFRSSAFNGKDNLVRTETFTWILKEHEIGLIFFLTPELYIAEFNIELYVPTAADVAVTTPPASTVTLTQAQIAAGYTFDFSSGNVPAITSPVDGLNYDVVRGGYIDINAIPASGSKYSDLKTILTKENGFSDYAFFMDHSDISFDFVKGALAPGKYEFEMIVYLADGASFNGICLHPNNSSGSKSSDNIHYFDSVKLYDNKNIYKMKLTGDGNIDITSDTNYFQIFYGSDTEAFYIQSIYIKKVG